MPVTTVKKRSKLAGVAVNAPDERGQGGFNMRHFHAEMQGIREAGEDITLKDYLTETFGDDMTPEMFYKSIGLDLKSMTVHKFLNTTDLNKYLFPEIFRDAIRIGLEYSPFYPQLIIGEERIESTGVTMPSMDFSTMDPNEVRLRDTNEGATITEGQIVTWQDKQVTVKKKARGLKQTYESIMFTPINLATVYFEELGTRMGSDLDRDLVTVAINGDQSDGSQSSPVIGAAIAGTLTYQDIARAWMRFKKLGRTSSVLLCSEADALTVLDMDAFKRTLIPNGITPSGVTLNISRPLPTSQDILIHDAMPTGKIMLIDTARAFVQLTAMPLLVESEKIVSRQLQGEYVSIMTGFANIFRDGRMILDYTTNLTTNPGPSYPT